MGITGHTIKCEVIKIQIYINSLCQDTVLQLTHINCQLLHCYNFWTVKTNKSIVNNMNIQQKH